MLAVIILVSLLPILVSGSTVQQGPLCTDSYVEFESASIGSNDSDRDIRNQLYKAFYAPNQHLPYSVIVTYQLVLTNGTRVNLSSDPDCSSELWVWLSSPALLLGDTTFFNRMLLFTLNYFMEWYPPHVTITTAIPPCSAKVEDFLSEMTALVGLCNALCNGLRMSWISSLCNAWFTYALTESTLSSCTTQSACMCTTDDICICTQCIPYILIDNNSAERLL